jgi:hypothetical protein
MKKEKLYTNIYVTLRSIPLCKICNGKLAGVQYVGSRISNQCVKCSSKYFFVSCYVLVQYLNRTISFPP